MLPAAPCQAEVEAMLITLPLIPRSIIERATCFVLVSIPRHCTSSWRLKASTSISRRNRTVEFSAIQAVIEVCDRECRLPAN